MTSLQTLRSKTAMRPRRIVGLLTLAWLSVVAQPCAMAFGAATGADCLHCPPGHDRVAEHSATDPGLTGHHAGHADHEPADRAAGDSGASSGAGAAATCEGLLSDCYVLSDAQFDSRSAVAKVKDAPVELPALLPSVALPSAGRALSGNAGHSSSVAPPGERRPLSVLYCVYRK